MTAGNGFGTKLACKTMLDCMMKVSGLFVAGIVPSQFVPDQFENTKPAPGAARTV